MESINSYLNDLAFELRLRDLTEDQREDILREVSSSCSTAEEARKEFGSPGEYADRFPNFRGKRKPPRKGVLFTYVGIVLGLIWLLLAMRYSKEIGVPDNLFGTLWRFGPLIVCIGLGAAFDTLTAVLSSRKLARKVQ